jgi:predicted  nucleic acid-binding Zn-ribbon protein
MVAKTPYGDAKKPAGSLGGSRMRKAIVWCLVVVVVLSLAMPVFAAQDPGKGKPDKPAKARPAEKPAGSVVKPPRAPANPLLKELKNDLAELHRLRVQTTNTWKQIASLKQKIKQAWTQLRAQLKRLEPEERRPVVEALRAKLAALKTQAKQIMTEIKALREQRKARWAEFKAAVQAKNAEAAHTALRAVISLQGKILEKAKSLENVVRQIWDAIKDVKPSKTS